MELALASVLHPGYSFKPLEEFELDIVELLAHIESGESSELDSQVTVRSAGAVLLQNLDHEVFGVF